MKPGTYNTLTNAEYHRSAGISKSGLDQVARSPAHYMAYLEEPRKQTTAFSIGTEAHRVILEPESDPRGLVKPDIKRRSNTDRAEWAEWLTEHGAQGDVIIEKPAAEWDALFYEQAGKYLLTENEFNDCAAMRESVFAHQAASELLENGVAEQSIYWSDEEAGELCKCRPDWIHDGCILVDLKSTDDASPGAFSRTVARFRYQVQDAMYSDGFAAGHKLSAPPPFVFIVVEKKPPYAVGVYQLEPEARELGRLLYHRDLRTLAEAKSAQCFGAYSTGIETIDLPKWAYYGEI